MRKAVLAAMACAALSTSCAGGRSPPSSTSESTVGASPGVDPASPQQESVASAQAVPSITSKPPPPAVAPPQKEAILAVAPPSPSSAPSRIARDSKFFDGPLQGESGRWAEDGRFADWTRLAAEDAARKGLGAVVGGAATGALACRLLGASEAQCAALGAMGARQSPRRCSILMRRFNVTVAALSSSDRRPRACSTKCGAD